MGALKEGIWDMPKKNKSSPKKEKSSDEKTEFFNKKSKEKHSHTAIEIVRQDIEENIIKKHPNKKNVEKGDIIYERKGFGWKGLGSRKIYYNTEFKEYQYEVNEP